MNLLEALYEGKFPAFCELNVWDEKYAKLVEQIAEVEAEMLQTCPEVSQLLDRYQHLQFEINRITFYHEFQSGFRIGAQLMEEIKPYPEK